jgi:hypothetical protein
MADEIMVAVASALAGKAAEAALGGVSFARTMMLADDTRN